MTKSVSDHRTKSKTMKLKDQALQRNKTSGQQRSLNAVFCGCIAARSNYNTSKEHPRAGTNTQLLPSCAVQSMKRLSISESDTLSPPLTTSLSSKVSQSSQNACLPSSVLFPNSLLIPPKNGTNSVETNNANSNRIKKWRKFKLHRKKSLTIISDDVKDGKLCEKSIINSAKEVDETEDVKIDEALVFSPLPSQKAPELPHVEHHTTLLGPRSENDKGKKCFVIDLDETLVHSSFKMVEQADFKVGVEIDGITHRVYVLKRPHVDVFLSTMANLYECVLFTASLAKYADPVADFLDKWNVFRYRLFRESCVYHRGNYVKDLSHLGRPINQVVILDNSPASYMFHASHAVQISSWFDDANDRALLDLIPYFEKLASHPNVVEFLRNNAPPTPHAAVGTVGLATGVFAALAPNSDPVGRPCGNAGVISNVRRPAVVSPLPISASENRSSSRVVPVSTSESHVHPDPRKPHGSVIPGSSRVHTTNALPVITKMAAPSSGPSVNAPHTPNDPSVSFPAPLSLATYLPIPPLSNSPVAILNTASGSSSQARIQDTPRPASTIFSPMSPSPSAPVLPQGKLDKPRPTSTVSRVSTPIAYTPYSSLVRQKSPPSLTTARKVPLGNALPPSPPPTCTSSGENHNPIPLSTPQKLGTVKSIPGDLSPLQTASPPPTLSQSSHTSRKPVT